MKSIFSRSGKSDATTRLDTARKALALDGISVPDTDPRFILYRQLLDRKALTDADATKRKDMYARWDKLYYPSDITSGGPDHWPDDPALQYDGKVHISLNTFVPYVDIPAHMQAIIPYVNAIPDSSDKADQEAADAREKLFWSWFYAQRVGETIAALTQLRALYGVGAWQPYWDDSMKMPALRLVESPEMLRIGWGSSDYTRKDWALLTYHMTPLAVKEDFKLNVTLDGSDSNPMVTSGDHADPLGQNSDMNDPRVRTQYEQTQVTVYDYWYREDGKVRHATYVENYQAVDEARNEYDAIPYVWIPNGRIPGSAHGPSEYHHIEQLIREKEQRMSQIGTILAQAVEGPMWQLNGMDAPNGPQVPPQVIPEPNKMALPGPGNTINPIQPWLPSFAGEEYLRRLDDEIQLASGLGPLQLGIAGAGMAGSSKAINAELAMYAPRIGLKREVLYTGILETWAMVGRLWSQKDKEVARILDGNYKLDIRPPELTVRDDAEISAMASNLVQNRIWSLRRAMDRTGVDNPSEEIAAILDEQTNAALNPAAVMQQIQLIASARQLQISPQEATGEPTIEDQSVEKINAAQMAGNPPPAGSQAANGPTSPAASQLPANAKAENGAPLTSQTMLSGGDATGRILSQAPLGG